MKFLNFQTIEEKVSESTDVVIESVPSNAEVSESSLSSNKKNIVQIQVDENEVCTIVSLSLVNG